MTLENKGGYYFLNAQICKDMKSSNKKYTVCIGKVTLAIVTT